MRILLALTVALASAPALAQDPTLAGPTPVEQVTGETASTTLWTTAPVELARFKGGEVVTVSLPADAQVTLVLADGDTYRVRRGTDFGWVAADQLTALPPTGTGGLQLSAPPL